MLQELADSHGYAIHRIPSSGKVFLRSILLTREFDNEQAAIDWLLEKDKHLPLLLRRQAS